MQILGGGHTVVGEVGLLAEEYVAEKVALGIFTGRSPRTVRSNLAGFAAHVGDIPLTDITRAHVAGWIGTGAPTPNTVRSRLSAVRGFLGWCVENEYLPRNPAAGVRGPRPEALKPRFLEAVEVTALLEHVHSLRDRLIVLLMVQMGLRRVEVWRANIEDIDARARTIAVRGKGHRGDVSRWSYIPDEAWGVLVAYLGEVGTVAGPLIRSRTSDGRLGLDVISSIVSEAMLAAGVKLRAGDGRSAHALRHTLAQHLIDAGTDIRKVQAQLGHASVTTTELYTRRQVDLAGILEGRRYGGA